MHGNDLRKATSGRYRRINANASRGISSGAAWPPQSPRVNPLTGDARDRRYFRVLLPDGPSIVLSLYSEPFDFDTLSFVNVARLLGQMPVPIPNVIGHADDIGVLALEDLGDVTLQAHLGAAPFAEHAALYRQAVTLIATMQRRGSELASPAYLPFSVAFDVEKLTWELDFFTKHFIEGYRGTSSLARRARSCGRCSARSRVSSRPSLASSATATITAET